MWTEYTIHEQNMRSITGHIYKFINKTATYHPKVTKPNIKSTWPASAVATGYNICSLPGKHSWVLLLKNPYHTAQLEIEIRGVKGVIT